MRIGGTKGGDGDVVQLLEECHARIRHFTATARRIGEGQAATEQEIREAATAVDRYFSRALPLHARDEDESIVPRLRGREAAVDRALDEMSGEHLEHDEPIGRVTALCRAIAEEPSRRGELGPELVRAVEGLEGHFMRHLAREEEIIFPAIRRLLGAEEQAAIVTELRARRTK